MNQQKPTPPKTKKPSGSPGDSPNTPNAPEKVAPLFRRVDWISFGITTLLVFIGYYLTLAPDLTLEDSGELAVGSFYAGVPHPPGYPVWTLYTWLFTVLVPVSNIAWRVALSGAVAGAFSCGLIALVVSRGSSMFIESIESLKQIERKWETALCLVAGFVAGMLMGFNGYMWSQSVIVEVYSLSMLSLMAVICLLLRWLYAPFQRRYLYFAFFFFGICLTNHMSLLVAAMGIEILIMAALPRLGRDLFVGNSIVYLVALVLHGKGVITNFQNNLPLFLIFNLIGIGSIIIAVWLFIKTEKIFTEWKSVLLSGLAWVLGASFYLYMPLASMTNPPMNWGYARTADGFMHALKRGQYESVKPTNDAGRLVSQLFDYGVGATEEFALVYLAIGLVPFLFYRAMQKRERAWLVGLTGIYLCLSVLLLMLLNPGSDRQSLELHRVFFTASHVIISIAVGYGLALIGAYMLTHYEKSRRWALYGSGAAVLLAFWSLGSLIQKLFSTRTELSGLKFFFYGLGKALKEGENQWPVYSALFLLGLCLLFLIAVLIFRNRFSLGVMLGLFALMPVHSILSHWFDNEQRGHLFGYWFGHDMFTPPFDVYPEMTKNAVLFGGTDPGRFCPTYMIFCESFIPAKERRDPKFDRRDVYIITQNALADGTYLNYIRAHYNRSAQIDPPFFQKFFHPSLAFLDNIFMKLGANIEETRRKEGVYPPKEILTPTVDDSARSFNEYLLDADRRAQLGQLKPGEDYKRDNEGRVSVSGQVAVMNINGLLTKVIFDKNPDHEFFVEESFPLDWMYPYLSPFGIIMKINREPLPEMSQEMVDKDHQFWSLYSDRLIGNWITYETPVAEICAFAEKMYLRHDFKGFKGDPKFIRDDNGQKAFSKLRSSIAGVYAWRMEHSRNTVEQQRMIKEADFAFKQAFAYCPFSPEAVYRYVNVLLRLNRVDDAILVVQTCKKLDPANGAIDNLLAELERMKNGSRSGEIQTGFSTVAQHVAAKRTNEAVAILDQMLNSPVADPGTMLQVARYYAELFQPLKLEQALLRLVRMLPDNPEAWYDLAGLQAGLGKSPAAIDSLRKAVELSNTRLKQQPASKDLAKEATTDERFVILRAAPEFQKIVNTR